MSNNPLSSSSTTTSKLDDIVVGANQTVGVGDSNSTLSSNFTINNTKSQQQQLSDDRSHHHQSHPHSVGVSSSASSTTTSTPNNVVIQIQPHTSSVGGRNHHGRNNALTNVTIPSAATSSPQKIVLNLADIASSLANSNSPLPKIFTIATPNGPPVKIGTQFLRQIQNVAGASNASVTVSTATPVPVSTVNTSTATTSVNNSELASLFTPGDSKKSSSSSSSSQASSSTNTAEIHHSVGGIRNTTTAIQTTATGGAPSSASTFAITDVSSICNNASKFISRVPISDEGMGHCKRCGAVGVKDTFYGKGKQFCSPSCVRGTTPPSGTSTNRQPLYKIVQVPYKASNSSDPSMVTVAMPVTIGGTPTTTLPSNSQSTAPNVEMISSDSGLGGGGISTPITSKSRLILRGQPFATTAAASPNQMATKLSHHQLAVAIQQSPGTLIQHREPNANSPNQIGGVANKNYTKRNYSKLVTLSSSSSNQQPVLTPQPQQQQIQLTNSGTLVAVNINQNANGALQQQPSPVLSKRNKRNSSNQTPQQQQQQNGQGSSETVVTTPTSMAAPKRARSKPSVAAPRSVASQIIVETSNNSLERSTGGDVALVKNDLKSNSILISQLKKPVGVVSSSPSATGANDSPLLVQLTSISSNSSRTVPTMTTATTATTISNQQLQQLIQQNNLRIAHQQQIETSTMMSAVPSGSNQISGAIPIGGIRTGTAPVTSSCTRSPISVDFRRMTQLVDHQQNLQQQQQQTYLNNLIMANNNIANSSANDVKQPVTVKPEPVTIPPVQVAQLPPQQPPPVQQPPPPPKPVNRLDEIKALDAAVLSSASSPVSGSAQTLPSEYQPPIWSMIFEKYGYDRCAPVWTFPNVPMASHFEAMSQLDNLYFEIQWQRTDQTDSQPNGVMANPGSVSPSSIGKNAANKLSKSNKKNSAFDFNVPTRLVDENDPFWFVQIVGQAGYYFRLRYVGLEHTAKHDFWVNFRLRNLYPGGYARKKNFQYKAPPEVTEGNPNYIDSLKIHMVNSKSMTKDLNTWWLQETKTRLKPGLKLEAIDKNRFMCYRLATVTQVCGQRCLIKYDGEEEEIGNTRWYNINSEYLRPIGWSSMVGHKLYASKDYAIKSLQRAIKNWKHHKNLTNQFDINRMGILKKFEFFHRPCYFCEGMKLEVVDPSRLSNICVATIRKVLRFNYLVLSIDDTTKDHPPSHRNISIQLSPGSSSSSTGSTSSSGYHHHISHYHKSLDQERRMFCLHASSPFILPPGFCGANGIKLTPPNGYDGEFDWSKYCIETNSLMAPSDFFSHKHFISEEKVDSEDEYVDEEEEDEEKEEEEKEKEEEKKQEGDNKEENEERKCFSLKKKNQNRYCQFEPGMLLEAVDMLEPNLICVAVVKQVACRLLLLHFIGWEDKYDQWCDCCSPNIFPVGYCDLIEYPLQSPPTSPSSSQIKKKRNNSPSLNGYGRKRNKRANQTPSPKPNARRPLVSGADVPTATATATAAATENITDNIGTVSSASADNTETTSAEQQPQLEELDDDDRMSEIDLGEDDDEEIIDCNMENESGQDRSTSVVWVKDIWTQAKERERSELYNFLTSSDEPISNEGPFVDHNQFILPLKCTIYLGDGRRIRFARPLMKQMRHLTFKLSSEEFNFEIDWVNPLPPPEEEEELEDNRRRSLAYDDYRPQIEVLDSYQLFDPKDLNQHDGTNDLRMLPHWSPKQVANFMFRNGFSDLCDSILYFKVDGKRLMSLTRTQALRLALIPSITNRLLSFIEYMQKRLMINPQTLNSSSSSNISSNNNHSYRMDTAAINQSYCGGGGGEERTKTRKDMYHPARESYA